MIDIPQKAMKCRACDNFFVIDYSDMQTIFCGDSNCSGVEKPQVDKQKLRVFILDHQHKAEKLYHSNEFEWPRFNEINTFLNDCLKKLDAGDFDVKD